jgi:hypothetical protein
MNAVRIFLLAQAMALSLQAQGTILWNEALDGPLSENYRFPTQLGEVRLGTNTIVGATELAPTGPNWFVHSDYFVFVVPPDLLVSSLLFTVDRTRVWVWVGTSDFVQQDGFTLGATNGNLLAQLGLGPLRPRGYGIYVSNKDAQSYTTVAHYRLDMVVEPVPEPGIGVLLLCGSVGLLVWCQRLRRVGR